MRLRGILFTGPPIQVSLMPPDTVLKIVDCAGQTASTSFATKVAMLNAPLRT